MVTLAKIMQRQHVVARTEDVRTMEYVAQATIKEIV